MKRCRSVHGEHGSKLLVGYLAGAEIAAALVIGGTILRGIGTYLRQVFSRSKQHVDSTSNSN